MGFPYLKNQPHKNRFHIADNLQVMLHPTDYRIAVFIEANKHK